MWIKQLHILFVIVIFFCSFPATSLARTILISNNTDFIDFADEAKSGDLNADIVFKTNLDFADADLAAIVADKLPLGYVNDSYCYTYSGQVEGNGYSIKNLIMRGRQQSGLFCKMAEASVQNLIIDNSCVFSGSEVGIITASLCGGIKIRKVTVSSRIESGNASGFIGSIVESHDDVIVIEDSKFDGSFIYNDVIDSFYAGGFIGNINKCENIELRLERNINEGVYSLTRSRVSNFGGFVGSSAGNTKVMITATDNVNRLSVDVSIHEYSYSMLGGFIGIFQGSDLMLTINNNMNYGHMTVVVGQSAYLGGYVGDIPASNSTLIVTNNMNECTLSLSVSSDASSSIRCSSYLAEITGTNNSVLFQNNTNQGGSSVEGGSGTEANFGGYIACHSCSIPQLSFFNNINSGFLTMSGSLRGSYYGGLVGLLHVSSSSYAEIGSVHIANNVFGGNAFFDLKPSNSASYYIGGMIGINPIDQKLVLELYENNTHSASIEGVFNNGPLYLGGIFGQLNSVGEQIRVIGNTNEGRISVSGISSQSGSSFISGIIGLASNFGSPIIEDNANYGNVSNNCLWFTAAATGMVWTTVYGNRIVTIRNCVNHGFIEGNNAYGITNVVDVADNIVNMGFVKGEEDSFSFWKNASEQKSIYGLDETCTSCSENVTRFKKNDSDGQYHTLDERNEVVSEKLNEEAVKNGYRLRWDKRLMLRVPAKIHLKGLVDKTIEVLVGTTFGDIRELIDYLKSDDYAIGDSDKNQLIQRGEEVKGDMTIIVMERNVIEIYMEEGVREVNVKDIATRISELTGIDVMKIMIDVVYDEERYVIRVIVTIGSMEDGEKIVNAVNALDKEGCQYGILCRSREAHIIVEEQELSCVQSKGILEGLIAMVMMRLLMIAFHQ